MKKPPAASERKYPIAAGVRRLTASGPRRTAVLLGAGASKEFEILLTSELLPTIVQSLHQGKFFAASPGDKKQVGAQNRRWLLEYLEQLLPGKSLSRDNLPLVTALLSLLDYSLSTGQSLMPRRSVSDTRDARALLERGILEAIADEKPFSVKAEEKMKVFCRLLTDLRHLSPNHPLTLITTNYDLAADYAAYECAGVRANMGFWDFNDIASKVDFGFPWHDPDANRERLFDRPKQPDVALLKLHGSTNWLRCPLCDNTYVNPWGPIWREAYKADPDENNTCHCSKTRLQTQIVSPSYVREMREPNLHGVWKSSLDALRVADHWLIIGYSFPDEDLAVRALFTRAYASRDDAPHVVVVQRSESSVNRYEAFFDRDNLTFCAGGLGALLTAWPVKKKFRRAARSKGRSRRP